MNQPPYAIRENDGTITIGNPVRKGAVIDYKATALALAARAMALQDHAEEREAKLRDANKMVNDARRANVDEYNERREILNALRTSFWSFLLPRSIKARL